MLANKPSPTGSIRGFFGAGEANRITFQSEVNAQGDVTEYDLMLKVGETLAEYELVF